MKTKSSIALSVANESNDFFPCVLSGRTPLCLDVKIRTSVKTGSNSKLLFSAREIFSGKKLFMKRDTGPLSGGKTHTLKIDLTPEELKLSTGCWHILASLADNGENLTGPDSGSCAVYAKKTGESILHARAGWNMAFAEFLYDRRYDIYDPFTVKTDGLPPTGDPFDPQNETRFRRQYLPPNKVREEVFPEHYHDGGLGFLYAAHIHRVTGEKSRAVYCEKVLKNFAEMFLDKMHYGDGKLGFLHTRAGARKKGYHCKQQDAHALKLLAQMFFHFHNGSGNEPDYARDLLERSKQIFDYQVSQPLSPGCGEHGCKVYDGRILSGLAWYCLAHRTLHGEYPTGNVRVTRFAADATVHLLSNRGWYDAGCMTEGRCHIWCGNMNLLNGLLPVRRMIAELASQKQGKAVYYRPHFEKGIKEAFRFLAQTNGMITEDEAPFVPSFWAEWAAGNMYELCDEYLTEIEEHAGVRQLMEHTSLRANKFAFHIAERNRYAVALLECEEYKNVSKKPPFPWRIRFG